MTEAWERVQGVFDRVLAAPPPDRATVLDECCGGDAALRAEVESLIAHHGRAGDEFLASPVVGLRTAEEPSPCPLPGREGDSPGWAQKLVGQKIGRYTVVRLIAHGGMGCVFEALQERPARAVALKVLQPGFSAPSALARFRLEPEVLGRLQHPNIAQVYEAGMHDPNPGREAGAGPATGAGQSEPRPPRPGPGPAAGVAGSDGRPTTGVAGPDSLPYFAMELIRDAQPLTEYADAHKVTTRQRLELFAKVCDAVQHGHQKGIIHRDLKPANILVGADGEPKVIDFGVARASDADIVLTTQCTHLGDLVGTVHYMSPEQCDGNPAAIDTRSDVYSLGVVLYELLTGAPPYDTAGTTIYGAIRVIKEEPARRPSERNWQLRGDLEAILLKALEKAPDRRYGSAADLAQDIRRHLAGEPIEARPPRRWQRLVRWAGRRPRTAAAVSAAAFFGLSAVATLVGIRAYVWYYLQEPVRIAYDNDEVRRKAFLLNRLGTPIHTWEAGENGRLAFAQLIEPCPEDKQQKVALVGYSTGCPSDQACQLHLYDLQRDPCEPVRRWQLRPDDLPQSVRAAGMTADQFSPANLWTFDVFPETHPAHVKEIVCEFSHNANSLCALCVFSLEGEPLYSVWHDGGIFNCCWMAGPGLLVCAAENCERFPYHRECPAATPGAQMLVVFALRPARGVTAPRFLDTSHPHAGGELVWYKWLALCPIPNTPWACDLSPPPVGDKSSAVQLGITIHAVSDCAISWDIDADGNRVGRIVGPTYRMARDLDPNLPPIEEFELQDSPPGEMSDAGQ